MGIITLRLNDKEEKMLEHLQSFYDTDKSKILKEAMMEKFEDLRDREVIENYEKKSNTVQFASAESLIKKIKNRKNAS